MSYNHDWMTNPLPRVEALRQYTEFLPQQGRVRVKLVQATASLFESLADTTISSLEREGCVMLQVTIMPYGNGFAAGIVYLAAPERKAAKKNSTKRPVSKRTVKKVPAKKSKRTS